MSAASKEPSPRIVVKLEDFYGVERQMTGCEAYKTLHGAAFRMLHELMDKHNGSNNGQIGMTVQQAVKILGSSKTTAIGALKELRVRGFVIRTHKADRTAPGHRIKGDHTTWLLTSSPYRSSFGTVFPASREYLKWTPGSSFEDLEGRLPEQVDKPASIIKADQERVRRGKPVDAFTRQIEEEGVPF